MDMKDKASKCKTTTHKSETIKSSAGDGQYRATMSDANNAGKKKKKAEPMPSTNTSY